MIYKLSPTFIHKIWGGTKLARLKNHQVKSGAEPLGETWEVSTHVEGPSFIESKTLESVVGKLNYLIKFIDTSDDLSIQVHPDNEYARKHENQNGKTECWLILEAGEDAGVYLGLKPQVTADELKYGIDHKLKVNEYLNFIKVSPGDFFWVPAGTIHAISKNVTMLEIQQNSGVTYRFWDWNRLDSKGKERELHIKQSFDVLNASPEGNLVSQLHRAKDLFKAENSITKLAEHENFKAWFYGNHTNIEISLNHNETCSLVNLFETIVINEQVIAPFQSLHIVDELKLKITSQKKSSFIIVK